MCHVSMARPAVRRVSAVHDGKGRIEVVHVDVERHELVDDPCVRVGRRVGAQLGVGVDQPRQLARRAGDVPHLDVVRRQCRRRLEQERPRLVGGLTALVARIEEPLPEKLELDIGETVVVEKLPDLGERSGLEHVLEVGVPEAGPASCRRAPPARSGPAGRRGSTRDRRGPRPDRRLSSRDRAVRRRQPSASGNLTCTRSPGQMACENL